MNSNLSDHKPQITHLVGSTTWFDRTTGPGPSSRVDLGFVVDWWRWELLDPFRIRCSNCVGFRLFLYILYNNIFYYILFEKVSKPLIQSWNTLFISTFLFCSRVCYLACLTSNDLRVEVTWPDALWNLSVMCESKYSTHEILVLNC